MRSVIVILGGGLHKNEHGVWQTNSYEDLGDNFGLDGHRLRVEAAAFILEDNPASVILASGGKGQYEDLPDSVPLSAVIKKELVEIGVLAEKIVEEDQSGSSYRQLTALDKLILENRWDKVQIISNGWHFPRIKAMIEFCEELKSLRNLMNEGKLLLCDADQILLDRGDPHWKTVIERTVASAAYRDRVEIEKKGVEQIRNGTYKFRK